MPYPAVSQKEKVADSPLVSGPFGWDSLFSSMTEGVAVQVPVRDPFGAISEYRILAVNPAFERLTGLSEKKLVGRSLQSVFKEDCASWLGPFGSVSETGKPVSFESFYLPRKVHLLVNAFLAGTDRVAAIFTDITDRVREGKRLEAALREREVLLRELYHRTKNNLQFVSGLIALQIQGSSDLEYRKQLTALEQKIQGMAVVHRRLYESTDLQRFKLKDYIEELASTSLACCTVGSSPVKLTVDCAPFESGDEVAIALGLIVNEFLQNVAKYAFQNGKGGKIAIRLQPLADRPDLIELSITDNGVGLPADFEERRKRTTGLSLVEALVTERLHGSLSFESGRGAICRAVFPAQALRKIP